MIVLFEKVNSSNLFTFPNLNLTVLFFLQGCAGSLAADELASCGGSPLRRILHGVPWGDSVRGGGRVLGVAATRAAGCAA